MISCTGSSGDDVLEGGPGQDYFNCGDGVDVGPRLFYNRGRYNNI